MSRRRTIISALLTGVAVVGFPASARATFPGQNGTIAFTLAKYDKQAKDYGFLGQGALLTINSDGANLFAFPDDEDSNDGEATWSPDGTQLAYAALTNGTQNGIYAGRLDAWASRKLIVKSNTADAPSFSPDGKTIVYTEFGKGIYSVPADGSTKPTLLLKNAKGWLNLGPSFTPNGSTIVLSRYKATKNPKKFRSEILAVDASGANARVVVTGDANRLYPDNPDVSPDGTKLVFAALTSEGRPAIWTAALDGSATNVLAVASGTNYLGTPSWSPDGKKIAAIILKPTLKKGSALVTIDAVSGALTTVRKVSKAYISSPSWQPLPVAPPAA